MAEVWQLLLSLLAIAALVLMVRLLKLGDTAVFADEADACRAGEMAVDGFAATRISISADGAAALLMDGEGRILLLRRHGSHPAGRLLDARTSALAEGEALTISTSDRRFGPATLILADAQSWKGRIDALKQRQHA